MTQQLVLFLMLIILSHANAQEIPYKFSQDIFAQIDEKQNAFALQLAATNFAFKGDYINALKTWNQQRSNPKKLILNNYDSIFFHNSIVVSAKKNIIDRSKKVEIIILNELHHNPSHRVFASSLLNGLYERGHKFLGL